MKKEFKILIVDDNTQNLSILGNILMAGNYSVQIAQNGKQCINLAHKKQPDLILLDINMPEMSGFEVCEYLKNNTQTAAIPIIFLTAYTETDSVVKGFSLGAVDYVTKPFREKELLSRVKTHLELKRAHEKLKEQNDILEALNSTKDKLFSIIAHDLRSPVGLMMNLFEILPNHSFSEEKFQSIIKSEINLAKSTYFLLENLLNWARHNMGEIKFEPNNANLIDIINEVLKVLKTQANQKNIDLSVDYRGNCYAFADKNMLLLIIRNLLTNAIKFTPEKGDITIRVNDEDNNRVKISVIDNGEGIAKENIRKILNQDEFYSTYGTNNESGSGLGLKLVKGFIEKNNSELIIDSEPGKGSCFSFILPASQNKVML